MSASFESLAELYGTATRIVRRNGLAYPAAIEPVSDASVDGFVAARERTMPLDEQLDSMGKRHVAAVRRRGATLYDGEVVVLERVKTGRVSAVRSSYFAMLASCDALRNEYLGSVATRPTLADLPLRAVAHAAADGDPLHCGIGRAAALGVSVLITVPAGEWRAFLLGRRQWTLATDPGIWHVVPSGMVEDCASGDPVLATAAKELWEELSLELSTGALRDRLAVLGVGYDLLRLKPEVCLRLDLDTIDLRGRRLIPSPSEYSRLRLFDVSPAGLDAFWRDHAPDELTPAAAATVALLEASAKTRCA